METILDKIIAHKKKEVEERKTLYPEKLLERSIYMASPTVSMKKYLQRKDKVGIIAEIKRKSPSKGFINKYINVEHLSIGYMMAGASAISVLTDKEFFGGTNDDLTTARKYNYCPILRKDFMVDEYQIVEAKAIGADVILLLANVLSPAQVKQFAQKAHSLGLEVLLEIAADTELGHICAEVDMVGVNNRNLKDFSIDINRSLQLAAKIPNEFVKVSESGLSSAEVILKLKREGGFQGFLIGENFMKSNRPEVACAELIAAVKDKEKNG